jgi:DNA-binding protein H-NS
MHTRLETLQRLVTLYAAVEEMHSTELQRKAAAVREAQQAIGIEQEVARSARIDGRGALLAGDRVSWMMAEGQQETAGWRRRRLEQIRLEREELNEAARKQYVASRLKREQIERVFDDIAARMEIEEGRRLQAASDDRFLARRRWTDRRKRDETTSG